MGKSDVHILLSYQEDIKQEFFSSFLRSIDADNLELEVEPRPSLDMQASMKWLMPTAVILFITQNYFSSFLSEAGQEHYEILSQAANSLWNEYLNHDNRPKYEFITSKNSPEKLPPSDPYTFLYSMMYTTDHNLKIKFLFQESYTKEHFFEANRKYFNFLEDISKGIVEANLLEQMKQVPVVSDTILLTYDPESDSIQIIRPFPEQ